MTSCFHTVVASLSVCFRIVHFTAAWLNNRKTAATDDDNDDDDGESRLVQNERSQPVATHSVSPLSGAESSVRVR